MTVSESPVGTFVTWDYVVFALLFVVSSGIGVFFAIKERNADSSTDFLVGGRQMTCVPVALSLTASFMSAVTVLGSPADVYRFGASYILYGVAYVFVVVVTAELFVPVFYNSGITSTYEVIYRPVSFITTHGDFMMLAIEGLLEGSGEQHQAYEWLISPRFGVSINRLCHLITQLHG